VTNKRRKDGDVLVLPCKWHTKCPSKCPSKWPGHYATHAVSRTDGYIRGRSRSSNSIVQSVVESISWSLSHLLYSTWPINAKKPMPYQPTAVSVHQLLRCQRKILPNWSRLLRQLESSSLLKVEMQKRLPNGSKILRQLKPSTLFEVEMEKIPRFRTHC
jgi:hypothetical protein